MAEKKKALLIDITKCIGCHSCEVACKTQHNLPGDPELQLSETALTTVQEHEGKNVRRLCMHCEEPACASALSGRRFEENVVRSCRVRQRQVYWLPLLHDRLPEQRSEI